MTFNGRFLRFRDYLIIGVPAILVIAAAFWSAFQFVQPAPPNRIVAATASKGSPYYNLAERYQKILARDGVKFELLESQGSFDNLRRLRDRNSGVDVAFVQGGVSKGDEAPDLVSLGRVLYEPLWIFCLKSRRIARLSDLKGKRVLVGPAVSGTSHLAIRLLTVSGVTAANATLINRELRAYPEAFAAGEADAGFLSLGAEAATVQTLLRDPKVRLVNLAQSDAYLQRFPFLTRLELKEGVVDFDKNIPPRDTVLLATTAALLARDDLHPALANLLAQTLVEAHGAPMFDSRGEAPLFQGTGQFPISSDPEYAMADESRRVYRTGAPLLQRYMPFWAATLADRLMVMALPVLGILLPVFKLAPVIYAWLVRRRILKWYKALKSVEVGLGGAAGPEEIAAKLARVEEIESAVNAVPVPLDYASQIYDLRQHIDVVRRRLAAQKPA